MPKKLTCEEKLIIFLKKRDVFKSEEFINKVGSRASLSRIVKAKKVMALGGGYYGKIESDLILNKLKVLSKYYPKAVLVGQNALWIQGYIKKPAPEITVQVDSQTSLKNTLFKVKRVKKSRMGQKKNITFQSTKLKTYSLEKLLCLLTLDKSNSRLFTSIVKELKRKKVSINLTEMAKHDVDLHSQASKLTKKILSCKLRNAATVINPTKETLVEDILLAARKVFTETGLHGTSLKKFSDRTNIKLSSITNHFKNINELKQAMCDQRIAEIEKEIYEWEIPKEVLSMKPVDQIKFFIAASLDNTDRHNGDEEFSFQAWAIAEKHNSVFRIVKTTCGPALDFIKNTILQNVRGISTSQAEARAVTLISAIDGYNYLRWIYIDALETESSKVELLQEIKRTIVNLYVPQCFAPPLSADQESRGD